MKRVRGQPTAGESSTNRSSLATLPTCHGLLADWLASVYIILHSPLSSIPLFFYFFLFSLLILFILFSLLLFHPRSVRCKRTRVSCSLYSSLAHVLVIPPAGSAAVCMQRNKEGGRIWP